MPRRPTIAALALLAALAAPSPAGEPPEVRPVSDEERDHWAYRPPVRPDVPEVADRVAVRNPIDAFIQARLEAEGIRPAPEAGRAALLRRLSFDLVGLPPPPEEVAAFEADDAPDAYEKQVERLLASPHHGERWAQHWLDLARYADSDGFEFDHPRPDAWRYRDWVVDALNRDLPYDRFVRLQLAGDEVEPDDPSAFVATGFNRCYPDMVDLNDQGLRRQNALDDIAETTGMVFLGLTLGCARCHDHKFDALRQADFYRLQAFFTPARFRDDYPIATPGEREAFERARDGWEREVADLKAGIVGLEAEARNRLAPGLPPGSSDDAAAAWAKAPAERTPREVGLVHAALARDGRVKAEALREALGDEAARRRDGLRDRLARLEKDPPRMPTARGLDEAGPDAPPTFLRVRGEYARPGPEVEPGFPMVLDGATPEVAPTPRSSGRRRALADWLVRPDNPLTARVIVNRLWQHHFGRGIVATPSDFGVMGEEPSHPDLLDWLAVELVEQGWSLKAMHRLMVTSAAYRRSTVGDPESARLDPENRLLGRMSRRRLDGEAIRDALLAVSGRLNPAIGGPGVFPELPRELARLNAQGVAWPVSPRAEDRDRRSLYVFVRRNLRYPFFEAFDRPDTNASCPRRPVTTIAPQALTLLNGTLAADAAAGLARRVADEAGPDPAAGADRAFRLALGRPPDPAEARLAADFLGDGEGEALVDFCLALLNLNEFVYVD